MIPDILLVLIAVVLSSFFAGSETAYTVAGKIAMEIYDRHGRRGARFANKLYSNPNLLFTITLVGNNISNVMYSSVTALLLRRVGLPLELIVFLSPVFLLFFCEILPKSIAQERSEPIALASGPAMWMAYIFLFPFISIVRGTSWLILRSIGVKESGERSTPITISDIRSMNLELKKSGNVDEVKADLIENVLSLQESKMREVMSPRTRIAALPVDASYNEAIELVQRSGFSRIPVYEENIDNIIGILYSKDLLVPVDNIKGLLHEAIFIPESASVPRGIQLLRKAKRWMLVVLDEYGGTAGIATLEDMIEEVVGEIEDEHDRAAKWGRQLRKGAYLLRGDMELDHIEERWGIKLPRGDGDYETVAGLITDIEGRIPKPGEIIRINGFKFRIAAADETRIIQVLLEKRQKI